MSMGDTPVGRFRAGFRSVSVALALLGLAGAPAAAQDIGPGAPPALGPAPVLTQALTQAFPAGTPLSAAWDAFVEAQNAENAPLALERLSRVEPLVDAAYGRNSREMAIVLGHRTVTLFRLGRLTDAEATAEEALAISRSVSGPTAPLTLDAINTLAFVYLGDRGDGPEQRRTYASNAARLLDSALNGPGAGDAPEATLHAMRNSLAIASLLLDRPQDAVRLYRELLAPLEATRGPTDPELISLTINLAEAEVAAARAAEAEAGRLTDQLASLPAPGDPALTAQRDALDMEAFRAGEAADRRLSSLIDRTPAGAATATLQYANLLSARARLTRDQDAREAARRAAVALYHAAGCGDAESRRDLWRAAGGRGYPWTSADPDCPGDLRLARELSGYRGLAFVERLKEPPRRFAALRHLAHAGDVAVGATRLTYARSPEARLAFNRYRHVHREFVETAWAAGQ
jgi:hypothetical protein